MRLPIVVVVFLLTAGCTGSDEPDLDQDDDLIEDAKETEGVTITIEFLEGPEERRVTSDPTSKDTDGDGLLDGEEMLVRGTDPRDVDTDDDGLLDGEDVATERAPAQEWRALGILEIEGLFLGELDACASGDPPLRGNKASSDLPLPDALGDGEELRGWEVTVRGVTRQVTSDPCKPDTDGDGALDHEEKTLGTDPRAPDTDHDGVADGVDGDPLWDLSARFGEVEITGSNATAARVTISVGDRVVELRWPGNASAVLEVGDQTADRASLPIHGIVQAEDATGQPLALFPDPRGAVVSFDLLQGAASGATTEGERLRFEGDEGALSLRWTVERR